jgi:hypothetical protein
MPHSGDEPEHLVADEGALFVPSRTSERRLPSRVGAANGSGADSGHGREAE